MVTTFIALLYAFIPDVSSAYWIFSVITTQVYLIVYLLMFVAAVRLRRSQPDHPRGYRAPMLGLLCVVGFAASLAAMLIGFIPPSQFGDGSAVDVRADRRRRAARLGLLVPFLFYRFRKPSLEAAEAAAERPPKEVRHDHRAAGPRPRVRWIATSRRADLRRADRS